MIINTACGTVCHRK